MFSFVPIHAENICSGSQSFGQRCKQTKVYTFFIMPWQGLAKKRVASVLFMDFAICFCIVYVHIIFFCYFPFISSYFSHFYYTKFVIQLSSVQFGSVEFCCSLLLVLVPLNNKHVRAIWLFVSRKYFWVIMCLS